MSRSEKSGDDDKKTLECDDDEDDIRLLNVMITRVIHSLSQSFDLSNHFLTLFICHLNWVTNE